MSGRVFFIVFSFFLIINSSVNSQSFKVLHYTETSGFDHLTRNVSHDMFVQLGLQYNFTVDNDSTGDAFNASGNLQQYSVIVFANTSGDALLDSAQRSHFEQYISNGGNVIGIHSASDTYRHSTANGSNTGTWDFYPELIGASVQQNPNHVAGTPFYNMYSVQMHSLLTGIPDPWYKSEEYYYWQFGYFDSAGNNILLKVDSTIGPNGSVNSYDSARATAWYKTAPTGSKIFYTSLGHAASNYTGDSLFKNLIRNAILWTAGIANAIEALNPGEPFVICYPNPFYEKVYARINFPGDSKDCEWKLCNTQKTTVMHSIITNQRQFEIDCGNLPAGIYFLTFTFTNHSMVKKRSNNNEKPRVHSCTEILIKIKK